MKNRKKAETYILSVIKDITKSEHNVKLYRDLFKSMSDKQFDAFMTRLDNEDGYLEVIVPIDDDVFDGKITVDNNIKVASKLNYNFEQRLLIEATDSTPSHLTTNKYIILDLPFRRTKQLLTKGIRTASDSNSIDTLTGQVKNNSSANMMTYPELQLLSSYGLDQSVLEIIKDRGGDQDSLVALLTMLREKGTVSRNEVEQHSGGVGSTKSLKNYFSAMHIKNNI